MVSSHNEWDPLKEVIVGNGFPTNYPGGDFTFRTFFYDNIYDTDLFNVESKYINKQHIDEHNEDIENFVDLLGKEGVRVLRPKVPKRAYPIKTPWWESYTHPALNVRDLSIIIGNTIIETPPMCRFRYFENDYLKHIFADKFKNGAKWITAPRPLLLDSSLDLAYIYEQNPIDGAKLDSERQHDDHYMNMGHEICFDAANCMRMGTHILMNTTCENHVLGARWLSDILGDQYTVMTAPICDGHIDSDFIPLRPGLALIMRDKIRDLLPKQLQDWDLVYIPQVERDYKNYLQSGTELASPKIDLNILSLSPDKIVCHTEYITLLEQQLRKYNIDVIPCQMRHCQRFAGGHHCLTLDTIREGQLQNYVV